MPSPPDAFRAALVASADVLAELPRRRAEVAAAKERVARLAESHPAVRIDLAVDLRPGSGEADYDLLLEHPDGGTVAVSYRPDRGNPWLVDYAEHWAANFVLTVGDVPVLVEQALTALEVKGDESPGLIDGLIDEALVERAMGVDPPEVTHEELQAAVDAFRAARGLHSASATRAWLERLGWSVDLFQTLVGNAVRWRKMAERVTAGQIESYFEAHRARFDVVRLFRTETPSAEVAWRLAALGAEGGLLAAAERVVAEEPAARVEGSLATMRAHELPPELADAAPHAVIGPTPWRGRFRVAAVLARHPATLDGATRGAVRAVLFRRWLDEQRAGREVRWHWL